MTIPQFIDFSSRKAAQCRNKVKEIETMLSWWERWLLAQAFKTRVAALLQTRGAALALNKLANDTKLQYDSSLPKKPLRFLG